MTASIEHIFVLMLENRSFDHLLAYSGIPGLQGVDRTKTNPGPKGTTVGLSDAAPDQAASDPGHEFEDVDWQIYRAQIVWALLVHNRAYESAYPAARAA